MTPLASLATPADWEGSAYANISANLALTELQRLLNVATRRCEAECDGNRLAPFTGLVESSRMQDGDVEDLIPGGVILPPQAQMGYDYAKALGMTTLVRHFSVNSYPRLYPDMWTGGVTGISVFWPVQQTAIIIPEQSWHFEPDTGLGYFTLGTFVPPGATAEITYSGGYQTVPDDLKQACLDMTAAYLVRMLDPEDTVHDHEVLFELAREALEPYGAGRKY